MVSLWSFLAFILISYCFQAASSLSTIFWSRCHSSYSRMMASLPHLMISIFCPLMCIPFSSSSASFIKYAGQMLESHKDNSNNNLFRTPLSIVTSSCGSFLISYRGFLMEANILDYVYLFICLVLHLLVECRHYVMFTSLKNFILINDRYWRQFLHFNPLVPFVLERVQFWLNLINCKEN